jgi:hypothetical protein
MHVHYIVSSFFRETYFLLYLEKISDLLFVFFAVYGKNDCTLVQFSEVYGIKSSSSSYRDAGPSHWP